MRGDCIKLVQLDKWGQSAPGYVETTEPKNYRCLRQVLVDKLGVEVIMGCCCAGTLSIEGVE
jgi:hypothetical protein